MNPKWDKYNQQQQKKHIIVKLLKMKQKAEKSL